MNGVPAPIASWLAVIPSQNVGTLYAKIKPPFSPFGTWHKVDGWGQLCDGTSHRDMVHLMLYNRFPLHGKGWTYTEWRAEPDNPEQCIYPRNGVVKNPQPYSGIAFDSGTDEGPGGDGGDPITFAEPEPEEFTQGEALEKLTRCESALCFIIGAAAVVVLAFIAWQLLPVAVSYWN